MKRIMTIVIEITEDQDRYNRHPSALDLVENGLEVYCEDEDKHHGENFTVLEASYGVRATQSI